MQLSPDGLRYVRDLVYERAAIVLESGKEYLVEARLGPLAKEAGHGSVDEFLRNIAQKPYNGVHARVVEAMTTNETSFFRDIHPFEALAKHILPEFQKTRSIARTLRVWCAACSTGQEPYSLAMLIKDRAPQLAGFKIEIVATDINNVVLDRAKSGRYRQHEVNRGLPAPMLYRHFTREDADWVIKPYLREMVDFRNLNLIAPWIGMPSQVDIVFIRNVLIYFDVPTKKKILGRVRNMLPKDGVLFLGGAETTLNLDDGFVRAQESNASFYKLKQ